MWRGLISRDDFEKIKLYSAKATFATYQAAPQNAKRPQI